MRFWIVLSLVVTLCSASNALVASCLTLVKGPVIVDVQQCLNVDPTKFDTTKPSRQFIKDLDASGRKEFEDSYKGLLIKGRVVKSEAVQANISKSKGALAGKTIDLFIPPGSTSCEALDGKRITGIVDEQCCNGTGDAPCLLDTGFVLKESSVLGEAGAEVAAGDTKKRGAINSSVYKEANKSYQAKNYKKAAELFEKAMENNEIDVAGLFKLGNSYYHLDLCRKSLKPLKAVYTMQQNGQLFTDDELRARAAVFLLARCYAKINDPQNAVFYLNGFLLEPKKFKAELQLALRHKDFGWIHTSKEYRDFKEEAEKRLRANRK